MSKRQVKSREKQRRHQRAAKPSKRQVAAGAGLALGAALDVPAQAQATDFTVSNLGDTGSGSLRQAAIDAAANPGHDRILFASGLSGEIDLTSGEVYLQDVEVVGPGPATLTVKQTSGSDRVFYAPPVTGGVVSLSGLTVTGGNATSNGGGIFADQQDLQPLEHGDHRQPDDPRRRWRGSIPGRRHGQGLNDHRQSGRPGRRDLLLRRPLEQQFRQQRQRLADPEHRDQRKPCHGLRGGGAKFYRAAAPTDIINSTISGNTAATSGGGLNFYKTADTNLIGDTISGNVSNGDNSYNGGGGVFLYGFNSSRVGNHPTGHAMKVTIANTTLRQRQQRRGGRRRRSCLPSTWTARCRSTARRSRATRRRCRRRPQLLPAGDQFSAR